MGFLAAGELLSWEELKAHTAHIKDQGVEQLLNSWRVNRKVEQLPGTLRWGEEIEYFVVYLDCDARRSYLWHGGFDMVEQLAGKEGDPTFLPESNWLPEYGRHMIEATPGEPYDLTVSGSLVGVEESMRSRRAKAFAILPHNVVPLSHASFPLFGGLPWGDKTTSFYSKSVFVPDGLANPHPRFPSLTENVVHRRGAKQAILIPMEEVDHDFSKDPQWALARDIKEIDRFEIHELSRKTFNPVKGHIYMDSFSFGMGQNALQVTVGCSNINEARTIYDQFLVLAPLMLALSASTPALRGMLSAWDVRWPVIAGGCDDRTVEEEQYLHKSRYDSASLFIADCETLKGNESYYNDTSETINQDVYAKLTGNGMDHLLAQHFAFLWMRDPLVFFKDFLHVDNHSRSDHFESIQSTNWNSVRFKPPPPNNGQPSTFPWRVELRTMEAQVSDLEAAVISSFTALLAQVIVADGLEWYIPISLCDENMRVSYTQKAASEGFFWWRSKSGSPVQARIQEIFEGSDRIDGLMPRLSAFVESNTDCMAAIKRLKVVVGFLQGRASGELITAATYYRQLIVNHPSYQQDGLLTPEIGYAVMSQAFQISVGIMDAEAQAMFGTFAHHRELCCPQECVDTLLSCLTATTAPEVIFPSLPRKRFLTEDLTRRCNLDFLHLSFCSDNCRKRDPQQSQWQG
ncbi:MAG: uncharacterized protein KVP18_003728 [Porospora cf. gigantea A]|uniref:uncharacterized protein n=1 Tax=Porospora cf. gigantea A TaxID=2853593 RepID=UPI003559E7C8|nr:MAG: hypothetical protein KVP18_003728 [Porospora cf. gigantea A]